MFAQFRAIYDVKQNKCLEGINSCHLCAAFIEEPLLIYNKNGDRFQGGIHQPANSMQVKSFPGFQPQGTSIKKTYECTTRNIVPFRYSAYVFE